MSVVRLTADDARSVTAFNDVSGMNWTLAANTNYAIYLSLMVTANATTVGVALQLDFSGTTTRFDGNLLNYSSATAMGMVQVTNDTSSPFTFAATASGGTVGHQNQLMGLLEVGASGGTLKLQHGSETATLTTILRGSWGVCVPV